MFSKYSIYLKDNFFFTKIKYICIIFFSVTINMSQFLPIKIYDKILHIQITYINVTLIEYLLIDSKLSSRRDPLNEVIHKLVYHVFFFTKRDNKLIHVHYNLLHAENFH